MGLNTASIRNKHSSPSARCTKVKNLRAFLRSVYSFGIYFRNSDHATMNSTLVTSSLQEDRNIGNEENTSSVSPLTVGLILEVGVFAVVLGNLLVLAAVKVQRHWVITDVLLLSLSLADFVNGLIPLQLILIMNYFLQHKWTFYLCGAFIGVVNCLRFASAGTVTLIALERTFMIVSPFKYHTTLTLFRVKRMVAFNWVISAFFASLPFTGIGKVGYKDGQCFYHLSDLGNTYAILILSISFVLLTVVLACYFAIKFSSTQFVKRQTEMYTRNQAAGSDPSRMSRVPRHSKPSGVRDVRRMSFMMAVVVILYYFSWLPILITSAVTIVTNRKPDKLVVILTGMVSLTYALANPVLYGKMSTRYGMAYKQVFRSMFGCFGKKPRTSSAFSISMFRTPPTTPLSKEPGLGTEKSSLE